MAKLDGVKVAMVLADNFEDSEAIEPKKHLEELGATVTVVGLEAGEISGKKGATLKADTTFKETSPDEFDAMIIPGGGSPENLRIHDEAVSFAREMVESGKPVASICHGPQLLISADVLRGKTVTSVNKIRDDVINAGANYVDEEVVIDENLITSRVPKDIPAFNKAFAEALAKVPAASS
ncbi:MAG TPA: type 1 glutamine amidotransferase domain-containing protein [Thermomicrobiales bacterium]|nr:type 1 glutamine amidotransferase domain-containing protein [Thermomicrobiales bacterium]